MNEITELIALEKEKRREQNRHSARVRYIKTLVYAVPTPTPDIEIVRLLLLERQHHTREATRIRVAIKRAKEVVAANRPDPGEQAERVERTYRIWTDRLKAANAMHLFTPVRYQQVTAQIRYWRKCAHESIVAGFALPRLPELPEIIKRAQEEGYLL